MKINKYLLLALTFAGVASCAQAQKIMRIHLADGSSETRKVSDVVKITFEGEGEDPGPQPGDRMVDLGLSVKWATYNMGATAPEEAGNFYAYGETEPKEEYSLETYQWYYPDYNDWDCDEWEKYYRLGTTITGSYYDVAHMKWGEQWRMPTREEFNELIFGCSWQKTGINGVSGMLGTSKVNGNTIFFPCAGNMVDAEHTHDGTNAFLWTASEVEFQPGASTQECRNYRACLDANYQMADGYDYPEVGFNVRAVYGPVPDQSNVSDKAPEMIDLGLTSGVKWASCNLGASSPGSRGAFLCWGEMFEKPYTHVYNYTLWNPYGGTADDPGEYFDTGANICGTEYDCATQILGDGWRMPTKDELQELIDECTWEFTSSGAIVTGPNGNTITIPAYDSIGYKGYSYRGNESVIIRSGESETGNDSGSYILYAGRNSYGASFSSPEIKRWGSRAGGYQVRPVHD